MKIFTVHEPPVPSDNAIQRAVSLTFIKYGFSWCAFFFPLFYFIFKNQWFVFCVYNFAIFLLLSLVGFFQLDVQLVTLCIFFLNIYFGFESSSLYRFWLGFRGWKEVGCVTGQSIYECERRFFSEIFDEGSNFAFSEAISQT